jgi:hypothetical protein
MPITTTLRLLDDVLVDTTKIFPASITIPVLSSTPLATNSESNSKYSVVEGVDELETEILIFAEAAPLLHIDTVATANVAGGQVYTEFVAVVVKSATPNLPVGISYFSNVYVFMLKSS